MIENEHLEYRHENGAHWLMMHKQPHIRPCFHEGLLAGVTNTLGNAEAAFDRMGRHPSGLEHLIVGSLAPVFNLGGDLEFFCDTISNNDRDGLMAYAMNCIEGVHAIHHHLHDNARTIALVEGDALGGGMELALSCQTIVMERGAKMGLPEVLFGLFPGMGAYPFLRQRVSPQRAESIILGGETYGADELLGMGVVDHVCDAGQGRDLVRDLIKRERRSPQAVLAMQRIRRETTHVTHAELTDGVKLWVDTVFRLPKRSVSFMQHLVRRQKQLAKEEVNKHANSARSAP